MATTTSEPIRCGWAEGQPDFYLAYHDHEWGVPVDDDRTLFEFLTLEGAQAGLSWRTILEKRAGYRRLFHDFEVERVARFGARDLERLLLDPAIVRNRLKIESTIDNARAFLKLQDERGRFSDYLWGFVGGQPIQNRWIRMSEVPPKTPLAETISRDLKKRGFRFVGPTILYAMMQAVGVVNDHLVGCFRHAEVAALSAPARAVDQNQTAAAAKSGAKRSRGGRG